MGKKLQALTEERRMLAGGISQFNRELKTQQQGLTGKVVVEEGGEQLSFKFEDGKLKECPARWSWAKGWSWADFKRHCTNNRLSFRAI